MFSSTNITQLILSAFSVLIALSLHEAAHAFVAYKLGDPTAKYMGRLTINPIKHIDPVGALFMILFHFGWAKPVPIDPRYFKSPKRDFAISALAGPLCNIIVGFFGAFIYLLAYKFLPSTDLYALNNIFAYIQLFLFLFCTVNIGLGIFNLIPAPPFDGSRILFALLPNKWYFKVMKYERIIYWCVIGWLFMGTFFYAGLMSVPFIANNPILSGVTKIFALSDLISDAIYSMLNLIFKFWQMIPFLK